MSPLKINSSRFLIWCQKHRWMVLASTQVVLVVAFSTAIAILAVQIGGERANRLATEQAEKRSQVTVCLRQRATGPQTVRIIEAVATTIDNSLTTAKESLAADPTSPLAGVRQASIERLQPALTDLNNFLAQTRAQIPAKGACAALAHELGVSIGS